MVHAIIKKDEEIKAFSMQPISYYKTVDSNICSFEDVWTRPSITLGELKRDCPDKIEGLIVKCVEAILKHYGFNAKSEITTNHVQVSLLVRYILDNRYYLTINDIVLMFKMVRENPEKFCKFSNGFEASSVVAWMDTYEKDKAIAVFLKQPFLYYESAVNDISTIKDALTRPSPTLGELTKDYSQSTEGFIIKCIEIMLGYYGFDARSESSVGDFQVHTLARDIISKYFYLTMNDLVLLFKKARQNPKVYGTFYGRFDASLVMKWFSIYDKERDDMMPSIPEESFKVQPTGFECSREDYVEMLEAMVAGGDLYANEMLRKVGCFEALMNQNKGSFFVYQWNRKHRLDEPMKKGGRR